MRKNFFQRNFEQALGSTPRSRRLALEGLESRDMLNADWNGFAPETTTEYQTGSAAYSVALPNNVDSVELVNLEGDSKAELVSIYGRGKTVSVYTTTNSGEYQLKSEQTISSLGNWEIYSDAVFADFNNDGYDEMLLVSSTGSSLNACVYSWDAASTSFVAGRTYTLDVAPFVGASTRYVFTGVSAALVSGASGGYDLVLQVSTLTTTSQTVQTAVYAGVNSASFGSSAVVKGAVTGSLLGSTTIQGEDYLVLKEATGSTNYLVLSHLGSLTTTKTYVDFSGYGKNFVCNWVVEQDGFLVVGAVLGSAANCGFATVNITNAPEDGATIDAKSLGQWVASNSVTLNASSVAAIGDVAGDSDPELLIANDDEKSSVFFLGDYSTVSGYTFTQAELVVASPDYNSVWIGDYNGDGKKNALLVGSSYLYVADVAEDGSISNQTELYRFSQPVAKAVFGDFNGDGLIDFAIQYKANVSSSFQVFSQIADGKYISVSTQSVPGVFADLTVGRFSQTEVDEIAVLYSLHKSSSTTTFASTYKFDPTKMALVSTTSFGYVGVGSAITSGQLYNSGRDDLVVVNSTADTVTVLRNNGSSFNAFSITTRYEGTNVCFPTSVAIGDFNGDGLNDLAVMNSSSGTNVAEVAYYLRSASTGLGAKPTGRVRVNSTITTVDNSSVVGDLQVVNLNSDGYDDLVFTRRSTNGSSYVSVLLGNGESSVFNPLSNTLISSDAAAPLGVTLAKVDGNAAYDFVWVQDKTFGVLMNQSVVVSSGSVRYVLSSLSSEAGATLSDDVANEREWLDEWSNFYINVWANAEGVLVTDMSGEFVYNPAYFAYADVVAAQGYNVSVSTETPGVVAISATGERALDSEGWTMIARLKFQPVENGGLSLAEDGYLYSVDPGFVASVGAQRIGGSSVAEAIAPTGVALYPVAYDLNDNGEVDLADFSNFISYYPANPVASIPVAKHRVLDVNGNNIYDLDDFSYAIGAYPSRWSSGLDSCYAFRPTISTASAATIEPELVASILDDETDLFDEVEFAPVEEFIAAGPYQKTDSTIEDVASVEESAPAMELFFCGPMLKDKYDAIDLDVELALEL